MAKVCARLALLSVSVSVVGLAGAGTALAAPVPHRLAAKSVTQSDFDGDGRSDLAVGAPGVNQVRVTYTSAKHHGSHTVELRPSSHPKESMNFGATLLWGDFNGDGFADLAVAAPQYTNATDVGAVFVFTGSKTGLRGTPKLIVDPDKKDSDIDFANTIALARGDQNGDGFTDLAVGSPSTVRIYHGSAKGIKTSSPAKVHVDGADSIVFADVNGDKHPDVVVGRSVGDAGNGGGDEYGQVDVFYGHAHGISANKHTIIGNQVGESSEPFEGFGSTLAVGDFDHDGYVDVAAGVPGGKQTGADSYPGNVLILYGGPHGLSKKHTERIDEAMAYSGARSEDGFGTTITSGDLDGDGFTDLIVDAPDAKVGGHAGAGAVYALPGSGTGPNAAGAVRITQSTPGVPGSPEGHGAFGSALFAADLVGNAHTDLAIGTPAAGKHDHGSVVVLPGSASGPVTQGATSAAATASNALFGTALA